MDINNHPIIILKELEKAHRNFSKAILLFSHFRYNKAKKKTDRKYFEIKSIDITKKWLMEELSKLENEWELAFHSKVTFENREIAHIPFVDFQFSELNSLVINYLKHQIEVEHNFEANNFIRKIFLNLHLFQSGRSFHGYSPCLISDSEWIKWMGSLLLLNEKGKFKNMVDDRWIGHRLIYGHAALRWSENTEDYLQSPSYRGKIFELLSDN